MTKREKERIARLTREDMEATVRELCLASIRLDETQARMNEELARVRERYEPDLAALSEQHKDLFAQARAWSDAHPEQFASRRSLALVHGTMLYRKGQPALKTLTGVTWEKVTALLKQMMPEYVRTKTEPDKAALLEARREIGEENLRTIGLRVDQAERFDIEVNKEAVNKEALKCTA